jgi:nucleotide-binding universal stress UspA family protein
MALFKHILVPTDGSRLSTQAAKYAVRLARGAKARLTVLHVIPPFSIPIYMDGIAPFPELYSPEAYKKSTEISTRKLLAKVEALASSAGVRCDPVFVTGETPWQSIVKTARKRRCDLVVMASHGRGGVAAVVLGSETTKVLAHSKTPVLVCR